MVNKHDNIICLVAVMWICFFFQLTVLIKLLGHHEHFSF